MDNPDLRSVVSGLVVTLRRLTEIVKIIPFIYLIIYVVYLILNMLSLEEIICWIDSLLTVSPSVTAILLVLSRTLKLCKWHRTACVLPLSTQAESFVDSSVFQFTQNETILIDIIISTVSIVFLCLAHKHFSNGRKRTA